MADAPDAPEAPRANQRSVQNLPQLDSNPRGSQAALPQPASVAGSRANLVQQQRIASRVDLSAAPAAVSASSASLAAAAAMYALPDKLDGVLPLFLTGMTQEIFKVKSGEDVSPERLFKLVPKVDLITDIQTRLAISDFYPAKALILQFPRDEMLLHFDPEYKYGQNFFLCVTPEAMDAVLIPPTAAVDAEADAAALAALAKPDRPREWKSLGSDKEIDAERVHNTREFVTVKVSRRRGEFHTVCKFGDRDAHDGFLEFRPYRDTNYDLVRMEVCAAVQAVPELKHTGMQTAWFRPINFACQYEPLTFSTDDQDYILGSSEIEVFLQNVSARFEQALQQNIIVDVFRDDYAHLGEDEMAIEQGAHTMLQEYQSFTDLVHSKEKSISCIDWHPQQRGILAISCTQRTSLEERIERGFNVRSKQSMIILWSFHDPIHPQLILEAPEDVQTFQFNPIDHNIIVGGCVNGQIVIWDIVDYQDKLKTSRKSDGDSSANSAAATAAAGTTGSGGGASGSGFGGDDGRGRQVETPILKHIVVSSIEAGHRSAVTDIYWLPQDFEMAHTGEPHENSENGHKQLVTASLDGTVAFWDLRFKKDLKSLDLTWRPFLRVPLSSLDNTYDYSLTKVCIHALVSDKPKTDGASKETPVSADKERAMQQKSWSSKFYCATEEGDLIYSDWIAEKTTEEKASRVEAAFSQHHGPISDLQRSPFFPDILLSVGGWSFHIWKEKTNIGPLLSSAPASAYLISGRWSPSRPGVFYIGRSDGQLEVWDLLDTSHAPSTIQSVTSTAVSYLQIHQYGKSGSAQQFIAVGDDVGTLHILEIPRNLQKQSKNEKSVVSAFFDREVRRLTYTHGRKQQRGRDRAGFEAGVMEAAAAAAKAAAAAGVASTGPLKSNGSNGVVAVATGAGGVASGGTGVAAAAAEAAGGATAGEETQAAAAAAAAVDDEGDRAEAEFRKAERAFLEAEGLIVGEDT